MTNPEVIKTLCSVDMPSMTEAINAGDLTRIRMVDGERPSEAQMKHILAADLAAWDAASEEMRSRMIRAENSAFAADRLKSIMVDKYGQQPGETVGDVCPRMSEADRREVAGLVAVMQDGDAS